MNELMTSVLVGQISGQIAAYAQAHPNIPFLNAQTLIWVRLLGIILVFVGQVALAVSSPAGWASADWPTLVKSFMEGVAAIATAEMTIYLNQPKPTA